MKVYVVTYTDLEKEECYYIPDTRIDKVFSSKEKAIYYVEKELDRIYAELQLEYYEVIRKDGYVEFDDGWHQIGLDIEELEVEN